MRHRFQLSYIRILATYVPLAAALTAIAACAGPTAPPDEPALSSSSAPPPSESAAIPGVPGDTFALRDGDTVVFLGDSITAARIYGKIIENYTLLRYPDRRIRFINAGWGGDTAAGGLARLERDVFSKSATVLTVAYGVNDIGWGMKADAEHKALYLKSIEGIVTACKARGVRVFLCSAAVTGADPFKSESDFLVSMCDEGMAIARNHGEHSIDVNRAMREIQKRVWTAREEAKARGERTDDLTLHAADGIHLNEVGQLAMAFAILKGLGAPADVSSAAIDAESLLVDEEAGCRIADVAGGRDRLEFTRLDAGLPFNYGIFFNLNYRFVPVPEQLNRYRLRIRALLPGEYTITADGRPLGKFSADHLASGIDIASATADAWAPGGPWNAQANLLRNVTDARHEVDMARLHATILLPGSETESTMTGSSEAINAKMEELQRALAAPRPYRFVVEPAKPEEKK